VKFPKKIKHRGKVLAKIYRSSGRAGYRVSWSAGGERQLRSFSRYAGSGGAAQFAENLVKQLAAGSDAARLSHEEARETLAIRDAIESFRHSTGREISASQAIIEYLDARRRLGEHSLEAAVSGFLRTVAVVQRKPLADAVEEFNAARTARTIAKPGKRPSLNPVYVHDTERQLRAFAGVFRGLAVVDLNRDHINAAIASRDNVSPKTRNHLRATLRMFLAWCTRRDYLPATHRLLEADGLRREPLDDAEIDYYRADEVRALLEKSSGSMRAVIALQALGGLRLQEALRLTWGDVFNIPSHVEVSSSKSKTRQRRLVEICPALAAWLEPFRGMTGKVSDATLDSHTWAFINLRKSLGIPSRRNGLRHAFCTYHYAIHANENLTAQQAGNSPAMIHQHYKGLATRKEAEAWFAVQPADTANVIAFPAVASA
jgi:integrase